MTADPGGVSVILASARDPAVVDACVASILTSLREFGGAGGLLLVRDTLADPAAGRWTPEPGSTPVRVLCTGGRRGSAYARCLGVEAARYDTLLFTDDDTLVPPDWAQRMAEALRQHGVVTGAIRSRTAGFWARCDERIDSYRVNARDAHGVLKFVSFPCLGITRELFTTVAMDTARGNRVEDIELACRLRLAGVSPHLADTVTVAALYPDSYPAFVRRKIRHGMGMGRLRARLSAQAWQQLDLGLTRDLFLRWIALSRDIAAHAGWPRRALLTAANLAYCCAFVTSAVVLARPSPGPGKAGSRAERAPG